MRTLSGLFQRPYYYPEEELLLKKSKKLLSILLSLALIFCILPATAFALDENETDIISSPCITRKTPTTISVSQVANVEYRLGTNGSWTTDTLFTGLYPNTTYTLYYRYNGGSPVSMGSATTPQADYITDPNSTTIDALATNREVSSFVVNCGFGTSLSMNYYVDEADVSSYDSFKLYIQREKYAQGSSSCTYVSSVITGVRDQDSAGYFYSFTYNNISACEIGDKVYATLYAEKNGVTTVSQVKAMSIADYAVSRLSATSNANYKKTLVDLVLYGSAAQTYFNYNTTNLAANKLTSAQKKLGSSGTPSITASITNNAPDIFETHNLNFDSAITLNVYFKLDDPGFTNLDKVKLVVSYTDASGNARTINIPKRKFVYDSEYNDYYASCTGFTLLDTTSDITLQLYQGNTPVGGTLVTSVEAYVANRLANSSNTNYKDLVKRLVFFSRSARSYFLGK